MGCVDDEDIKDDEDMNIEDIDLYNSFGAFIELCAYDDNKINDNLINLLEDESDFGINKDKTELSLFDYSGFDRTQDIINTIIDKL